MGEVSYVCVHVRAIARVLTPSARGGELGVDERHIHIYIKVYIRIHTRTHVTYTNVSLRGEQEKKETERNICRVN